MVSFEIVLVVVLVLVLDRTECDDENETWQS
jgi:hypothetical protein